MPVIAELRKEFHRCCTVAGRSASGVQEDEASKGAGTRASLSSPEALARRWLRLAEVDHATRGLGPLTPLDEQAVALRAAQMIRELDLTATGSVTEEEWVHGLLLLRGDRAAAQIAPLVRGALGESPGLLRDIQAVFERAEAADAVPLGLRQMADLYRSGVVRFAAGVGGGGDGTSPGGAGKVRERELTDEDVQEQGAERLARDLLEAMDVDGDVHVSYAEFVAFCIGRRKTPVHLNMYDLSKGLAKAVSPWLMVPELERIWHTGVVAFNREYFFAKDAVWDSPGQTDFGVPTKAVFLGHTLWTQSEMHGFICNELKPIFHRDTYDVISNNCNHFSDRLSLYLTGRHVPDEVLRQPDLLLRVGFVRALRPTLNRALREHVTARECPGPGEDGAAGAGEPSRNAGKDAGEAIPGSPRPISPKEELRVGTAVAIHSAWGRGCGVLGVVSEGPPAHLVGSMAAPGSASECVSCAMAAFDGCKLPSTCHGLATGCHGLSIGCHGLSIGCHGLLPLSLAPPPPTPRHQQLLWVRYFDLSPPPTAGAPWQGRVRLEAVDRSRVVRADPEATGASYQAALSALALTARTTWPTVPMQSGTRGGGGGGGGWLSSSPVSASSDGQVVALGSKFSLSLQGFGAELEEVAVGRSPASAGDSSLYMRV